MPRLSRSLRRNEMIRATISADQLPRRKRNWLAGTGHTAIYGHAKPSQERLEKATRQGRVINNRPMNPDHHSRPPDRSLIPLSDGSLAETVPAARRIILLMVDEVLALNRREQPAAVPPEGIVTLEDRTRYGIQSREQVTAGGKFRIGDHELREPDFLQVIVWSNALALPPEEVMRRLLCQDCRYVNPFGPNEVRHHPIGYKHCDLQPTTIVDGRIVTLTWAFESLPLRRFEWVDGLEIECVNIWPGTRFAMAFLSDSDGMESFVPNLARLHSFFCGSVRIDQLDFAGAPSLTDISIEGCAIETLKLTSTPRLRTLCCEDNALRQLDLSAVPELRVLRCNSNHLDALDLTGVPQLSFLDCGSNQQLQTLDLSPVGELQELCCSYSALNELDLSAVAKLNKLSCSGNKLTRLDLRTAAALVSVDCSHNQLSLLILGEHPGLTEIGCDRNRLTSLDLSGLPQLLQLSCWDNRLMNIDQTHPITRQSGLEPLNYRAAEPALEV